MCDGKVSAVEVEYTYICAKCKKRYHEAGKALACFNSHKKAIEILDDQSYYFGESTPNVITVKFDDDTTDIYYRLR